MMNTPLLRIFKVTMLALVVLFTSKVFASSDYLLQIEDTKTGKKQKVAVADDGSFEVTLPAGTYVCSWSFGASNPTSVGSSGMSAGRESSTPSVSEISIKPEKIVFSYEVQAPRDVATGQASGKRQHKPVTIRKEWNATSPTLFDAITIDESGTLKGKVQYTNAAGKMCSVSTYDVKTLKK